MWRMDSVGIHNLAREMQNLRRVSDTHFIAVIGGPLSHPQLDTRCNSARPEELHSGRITV